MKSIFKNFVISMGLSSLVIPAAYSQLAPESRPATKPSAEEKRGEIERDSFRQGRAAASDLRRDFEDLENRQDGRQVFFDKGLDAMRYRADMPAELGALRRGGDDEILRDTSIDRQRRLELVRKSEIINPIYNPVGR